MISRAYLKSLIWACALCLCSACDESYPPDASTPIDGGGLDAGSNGGRTIVAGQGGVSGQNFMAGQGGFSGMVGGSGPIGVAGGSSCSFCPCNDKCVSQCLDCGSGCLCQNGMQGQSLPWDPPFESIGDVGWKDSDEPLCTGVNLDALWGLDVWSDARGVFVVMSGSGPLITMPAPSDEDAGVDVAQIAPSPGDFRSRTQIWFNDGSEWVLRTDKPDVMGGYRINAIPDGPLLLSDATNNAAQQGLPASTCTLGVVRGGKMSCFDLGPVQSTFAVNSKLAYALATGVRLLAYDGTTWHSNIEAMPYAANALWADRDRVLAVGKAGTALWLQDGVWTQDDPGTLEGFTSVWGEAHDDLWAGTSNGGVFRYDGSNWKEVGRLGGVTCDVQMPITDIWGAEGKIYFATQSELARWDGKKLVSLSNWSCSPTAGNRMITGLTGTGPKNVFLSLIDFERSGVDACGAAFVVHYDGKEFHRM